MLLHSVVVIVAFVILVRPGPPESIIYLSRLIGGVVSSLATS